MPNTPLEQSIFKWDEWDDIGVLQFSFSDCEMLVDFGPLRKGDKHSWIILDYESSELIACKAGLDDATDENGEIDEEKVIRVKIKLVPA